MHCGQHRPRHDSRKAHGFGVKAIFPRLGPTPDASHHTGLILNEVVKRLHSLISSLPPGSMPQPFAFGSALRIAARYEGVPTTVGAGVVSLQLMKGLTMRRTIAHIEPTSGRSTHFTKADT